MQKRFFLILFCLLGMACSSISKTEGGLHRAPTSTSGQSTDIPKISGPFAILTKETLEGTVFSTNAGGVVAVSWSTRCSFDDGHDRNSDGQVIRKNARAPKLSCRDPEPSYATGKAESKVPLEVTGTLALLLDEELQRIGLLFKDEGYNSQSSTRFIDSKKVCLFESGEGSQQASLRCNYRCSTLREMFREAKKNQYDRLMSKYEKAYDTCWE